MLILFIYFYNECKWDTISVKVDFESVVNTLALDLDKNVYRFFIAIFQYEVDYCCVMHTVLLFYLGFACCTP